LIPLSLRRSPCVALPASLATFGSGTAFALADLLPYARADTLGSKASNPDWPPTRCI
jgi:hypothetical protein